MRDVSSLKCLVLNADGRPLSTWPLSVISSLDAVHDWYRDRVAIIETWPDAYFRSPSTTIAVPKVVMVREYAHVSGDPKFCRRSVFLRDRYCCQYCGESFSSHDLTFDHVVPRAKGGKTTWDNILTACVRCNSAKQDMDANYSGRKCQGQMRPLKVPRRPTAAELLRAGLEFLPNDLRENFGDFLYWNSPLDA